MKSSNCGKIYLAAIFFCKVVSKSSIVRSREENEQSIKDKSHDIKGEISKLKSKSDIDLHKKSKRKARSDPKNIRVDLKAKMGGISVVVTSRKGDIASILIGGMSCWINRVSGVAREREWRALVNRLDDLIIITLFKKY